MSEATCPWCGKRNTDLSELWPDRAGMDGWEDDVQECGWCEKPVVVVCRVRVDYEMRKRLEQKP